MWCILKSIWCGFHQLRMHYRIVFLFSSPFLSLKLKVKRDSSAYVLSSISSVKFPPKASTYSWDTSTFARLCYVRVMCRQVPIFIGVFQYLTFAAFGLLNFPPCHRRSSKTENLRPCCKYSFRKRCMGKDYPPEQNGCPSMVISHSVWFSCVENKREFER